MKKIIMILILMIHISFLMAFDESALKMRVISTEHKVINGTFSLNVEFDVKQALTFSRDLGFELPDKWKAYSKTKLAGVSYKQGEIFSVIINVNYPKNNIPYYSQRIRLLQFIESEMDNGTKGEIKETTYAKIYFTPYNTIEVWNPGDYYNLPRRWHRSAEERDTKRMYIAKNKIPASNVNKAKIKNWHLEKKNWDDDPEFNYITIPGLGYDILMMPKDMIDTGDGPDKTGEKATFTGTVKGRLTALVENDNGLNKFIPIAGIKVRLKEQDRIGTDNFGETYTDEEGDYSITYSKSQIGEAGDVELFVEFQSKTNDTYKITSSNWIENLYEARTAEWKAPQDAGTMTKNVYFGLNDDIAEPFKAVHWVRRGYQYFEDNGITLIKELRIKPYTGGSWYEPRIFPPDYESTIHLESGDGDRETVVFHEFGHAIMDKLQDNNFDIPYGENGLSHRWTEENTSRLAWIEGWANAMGMILDAAYWEEDGEYATRINHATPYFEQRSHYSWQTGDPTDWRINNGFRSEYYIACAIYDLWDGDGEGLPSTIPGHSSNHGWNDSGHNVDNIGWASVDDIKLDLYTICQPLIDHPTGNAGYFYGQRSRNIQDYYLYLLDQISDCDLKADISRTFRENRVLWNIPEYQWGWNITPMSSDFIKTSKSYDEEGYSVLGEVLNSMTWTDTWYMNFFNDGTLNTFAYSAWPSKGLKITDPLWLGIWDNFSSVYKESELYLNDESRFNIFNGWSPDHGNYQTCGGVDIDIRNGKLELGGEETTADLSVNDGSTLTLRNHGSLIINDNSTLLIECGATLVYEAGAVIELIGDNAQLIIKGNLETGNNAIFTFQGTGSLTIINPSETTFPYPNSSNTSFIGESGTSISIAAKNRIIFKPGLNIEEGCHFLAYIDPSLPDCVTKSVYVSASGENKSIQTVSTVSANIISGIKMETKENTLAHIDEIELLTSLIGNYPNPNSEYTYIKYKIGENCPVKIYITNMDGVRVAEILNQDVHSTGEFEINYNTSGLKPGIYFYTLQTDKYIQTRRMVRL